MKSRAGFTLIEVAVAAGLMAILAAATTPSFVEFLASHDAQATAKTLSAVASGVAAYESSVKTNGTSTNTYPQLISSLTNPITLASKNSCSTSYSTTTSTTLLSTYTAAFPYVTFLIPTGGLSTPLGMIQDQLVRTPANASVGTLSIVMPAVDSTDAIRLEREIDGDDGTIAANRTSGTFRITSFSGTGSARRTASVAYVLPVGPKC
ncbi:MAG TPA: type II secretion system protein [Gemmatimonadaceae bacterium]